MTLDAAAFAAELRGWAAEVLDEAGLDLTTRRDDAVPVGEATRLEGPRLRDSREVDVRGLTATIAYTAEHASYTDEGTVPHEIRGNPLLAFEWEGQLVIVHSVQHPGTAGTHWWADVVNDASLARALEDAAARVTF